MVDLRFGRGLRVLRRRRGWRQADLALRAGISQSAVSRAELGRVGGLSVAALKTIADALGAQVDVRLRWQGEGLDRLLDREHAALVEQFVRRLRQHQWEVAPEASFDLRRAWLRGRVGGTPPDWSSARRRGQVGHPGRPGNARGSGPQDPTRAGDCEGSRLAFDHGLEAADRAGSPDRTATARATRRYLPVGPPDPRTVHRSVVATPAWSARRTPVPVAYQSPGWRAPNSTRERRRALQLTLGLRLGTPDRAGLAGPARAC